MLIFPSEFSPAFSSPRLGQFDASRAGKSKKKTKPERPRFNPETNDRLPSQCFRGNPKMRLAFPRAKKTSEAAVKFEATFSRFSGIEIKIKKKKNARTISL